MGGDTSREPQAWYGSPLGGATMGPTPQYQMRNAANDRALSSVTRDRRSSEDVSPNEDIEMKFRVRIINDILKGKINLDELRMLHDNMGTEDKSLPNMQYFQPMA